MLRKIVIVCIICLFVGGCASQQPAKVDTVTKKKDTTQIVKVDFLDSLISIASEIEKQNQTFDKNKLIGLKNRLDEMCLEEFSLSNYYSIDGIQQVDQKLKRIAPSFDMIMTKYAIGPEQQDIYLFVTLAEILFRLYTESQEYFNYIFFNASSYKMPLPAVIELSDKLRKIHPEFMGKKSTLLQTLISLLKSNEPNIPSERIWIAVDRMLVDIDLNKSGTGAYKFKDASMSCLNISRKSYLQLSSQ